jgi:hypothetical protein
MNIKTKSVIYVLHLRRKGKTNLTGYALTFGKGMTKNQQPTTTKKSRGEFYQITKSLSNFATACLSFTP